MRKLLTLTALAFMLIGCASAPDIYVDKSLNSVNSTSVYLYRPSNNWLGLAIDYRVYANGIYVGSVKPGKDVQFYLIPGENEIKVSPHFMGMQDGIEVQKTLSTTGGERLYLRFTTSIDDIIFVPGGVAVATGSENLQVVTEQNWSEKN